MILTQRHRTSKRERERERDQSSLNHIFAYKNASSLSACVIVCEKFLSVNSTGFHAWTPAPFQQLLNFH